MKRTTTKKKLKLSVATVALIQTPALEQVVGGGHTRDGITCTRVNCIGR